MIRMVGMPTMNGDVRLTDDFFGKLTAFAKEHNSKSFRSFYIPKSSDE